MEQYREQFKKEKKRTYWSEGCDYGSFNDEYVNWLEQKLNDLEKNAIDVVERLIAAAEDNCFQYGCDAETDADVIDGRKLLEALKTCNK